MCEYIEPVNQNYEKMEDINDYDDIYINLQEDLMLKDYQIKRIKEQYPKELKLN